MGTADAGLGRADPRRGRAARRAGRARRDLPARALQPALAARLLEATTEACAGDLRRRLVPHQGRRHAGRGRLRLVRGARRRRDHRRRLPDRAVRGRVRVPRAPRGRRRRPRSPRPTSGAATSSRRSSSSPRATSASDELAEEIKAFVRDRLSRLRLSAPDRVRRRPAQDADGQDPPHRAARARARGSGLLSIARIGIVGAGFMGSGIAESAARAGVDVTLHEPEQAPLDRSKGRIEQSVARAVKRRQADRRRRGAARSDRVAWTTSLDDLSGCDLVVEAVVEDARVKGEVFQRLDGARRRRRSSPRTPRRSRSPQLASCDPAPGARAGAALLLAGAGDEARRDRRRARHRRRASSSARRASPSRSASARSTRRTARASSSTCCSCRT